MAPPPPTSITLKIKVPPGYIEGHDEFALGSVAVSTTIGAIRQQIQTIVPSHPAPERQRILYGGRALIDDDQTLADALNTKRDPTQTEFVVHLLVKGEQNAASNATAHRRTASTPTPTPPPQPQAQQPGLQPNTPGQQLPAVQGLQQGHYGQQTHALMQNNVHQQMMRQLQVQQQQMMAQMGQGQPFPQMPMMPQFGAGAPGFQQAVQQGQQQRAAMGMNGIGGQLQPGTPQPQGVDGQNAAPQNHATGEQQPAANGQQTSGIAQPIQPGQTPMPNGQQPINRPISGQGFHIQAMGPNGQRVQIHHHQQVLQLPGHQPGLPLPNPLFGVPPQIHQLPNLFPQQPAGPSALDRARDNIVEMRRLLDEMRNAEGTTEEQRQRIANLRERAQGVNDYIDPFGVHGANGNLFGNTAAGRRSASPNAQARAQPQGTAPPNPFQNRSVFDDSMPSQAGFQPIFAHRPPQTGNTPSDVTCYLLSGPQGPSALLFSPQHGTYTGHFAASGAMQPHPTPTTAAQPGHAPQQQGQNPGQQILEQLAAQGPAAAGQQNAAAQAQAQDPLGPIAPLLNHVWLLLRVLIFAYFLMGSNLGWRRPVGLLAIGLGFWMVRMGLFGEGGVARRWWDGVLNGDRPAGQRQQAAGQGGNEAAPADGQAQAANAPAGAGPEGAPRQPMPTPEQVAQRLLNQQNVQQDARVARLREYVRPIERAVALFVASLWPGIGEAHVREREAEERRRNEEEVAARRREEEARNAAAEGEKKDGEGESKASGSESGGAASGEKAAPAITEGSTPVEAAANAVTAAAGSAAH